MTANKQKGKCDSSKKKPQTTQYNKQETNGENFTLTPSKPTSSVEENMHNTQLESGLHGAMLVKISAVCQMYVAILYSWDHWDLHTE